MPRRSPSFVLVHVVWATLGKAAKDTGSTPLAIGCASDHVHVLVRLGATVALADLVQQLKGGTAYEVNRQGLLSWRLAWQAGYWAESFGPVDLTALVRYVRDQRAHHDDSHPAEVWQAQVPREPAEGGL